jgi:hypothetical protein
MEGGRREFLGKLFGNSRDSDFSESPKKSVEPDNQIAEKTNLSRRGFLKKSGELAVVAGVFGTITSESKAVFASEKKDSVDFYNRCREFFNMTKEIGSLVKEAVECLDFPKRSNERTIAEQDIIRDYFLEHFKDRVEKILGEFFDSYFALDELTEHKLREHAAQQFEFFSYDLASVGCYGLCLRILSEKKDHENSAYRRRNSLIKRGDYDTEKSLFFLHEWLIFCQGQMISNRMRLIRE